MATAVNRREGATVLLVEDDPTLRSTLAFNLGKEGYTVHTVGDGLAAVDLVTRLGHCIDLAILDVTLPGMSGFQVLRVIRDAHDFPVLILTARGEEQDRIDGLELGADDYVVKPFALPELLARVRAGIRRNAIPARKPPRVLYRGILKIEIDRRRATVRGQELQLRPKEFGLLVTLALDPGKVFERQELIHEVWGPEVYLDKRTVDVHISWLRGKLADAGMDQDCIRTVYGAGYRFTIPETGGPAELDGLIPGKPTGSDQVNRQAGRASE